MKRILILLLVLISSVAYATVNNQSVSVTYSCSGSTGPYPFSFPISNAAALTVTQDGVFLSSSVYSVTAVNNNFANGGSVTLNSACNSPSTLVLKRVTPVTQTTVYTDNMPIPMKTFERSLDKLTEISIEQDADLNLLGNWVCPAGTVSIGFANLLPQCGTIAPGSYTWQSPGPIGSVVPNSGAFTSLTANYNLGVAAPGGSHYLAEPFYLTWTGNASGNSDVIGFDLNSTCGGPNNVNFCMTGRFNTTYTASANISDRLVGGASEATHNGTGSVALMYGHQVRLGMTNTGSITGPSGFMANYVAEVPAWTGSGTSPNLYGYWFKDPGNASTVPGHVTNEILGFGCADITMTIPNIATCISSAVASGTNKWNMYIDGTASNWIRGATGIGQLPTSGDQLDVGGLFRLEGVSLNSLGTYGKMMFNSSTGFTANARKFLVTNALLGNAFAIIRSVDSNTDPTLNGTTGAITSGTADITISVAGVVGIPNLTPGSLNLGSGLADSSTAPTISSGFGSSPGILASNGTASFRVNVGTGGSATSGVISMPAAPSGWNCYVNNLTAAAAHRADNTRQTASATNTVTVENQTTSSGAAVAWSASDTLTLICRGF